MEESLPTAAAPEESAASDEKAEPEAKPRGGRRRFRVPTSVLVTVLVAVLSVLVAPAFARQWDDRQKVRQLRAAFAQEIATGTARTLATGVAIARIEDLRLRGERSAAARGAWDVRRLTVEMKLRAYFPQKVAARWSEYGEGMTQFLAAAELAVQERPNVHLTAQFSSATAAFGSLLTRSTLGCRGDERV